MRKTRLSNGIRLLTIPRRDTSSVTVLILIPVGSRFESKSLSGGSHFIEHMMFKGTKRRPTTLDISRELDAVGAEYNAFTSKNHTGYYIKINHRHIDGALDLLSDMLSNSVFDSQEITKEKNVIVEEINMYEDNPTMQIEDLFESLLFGPHTKLGQNIAGTRSTVKNLNRRSVLGYMQKHYIPNTMVITIAGKLPSSVTSRVERKFKAFSSRKKKPTFSKVAVRQSTPRVKLHFKDTQQVHLALGFPGLPHEHKNLSALTLLTDILGGTMSSRLFVRIREQLGLAYSVRATMDIYRDTGTFMVLAGLDKGRIRKAIDEILNILREVKRDGVTHRELTMAKEHIAGKLGLELEQSENLASWYGRQEVLLGKTRSPRDRLTLLKKVKRSAIQRIARSIFTENHMNLVLIGPYRKRAEWLSAIRGKL